ncbi:TPA: CCA tRNA nucleotidyltransferase [Streptococcus suis 2524]|uniref:CCA tRNA nucleotidyltransferase n=1 Tax=Streptococcus suis TaxID=1307 RepID=UPI00040E1DDC|nr:CCA tRNA nucleotidyltransferase [Streptococcus suis]RRR31973.1 CCA tRNA nucleotidyltransferase [Streptococcus suis]RRR38805.1 CCA tRNA nucleotidyltransferase [Streptococcus suis]RRR55331.1 CCA tRNA nucleotidyltransferase [Streptococcus suis]RRR59958.1 CCA tRNA nucleotidyltransferase [Streptococcus suis]HEM3216897.1 CCA tRNA nucleotidyltransferase [Streptococcus suis 2524]
MKLNNLPSEFQEALPILEKIKAAGYEAYFVGGSVRDAILGRPIHDVDIATSSYPQETKQIFSRTIDVGIEHGTVLVLEGKKEYEITTFRTEEEYVDFRRPSQVSFVRSLEEDLKRRDFTVNAFALDEEAQIVDLFDGMTDLENRTLRAVGIPAERFNEDALRIMRGFRFAATLDFEIEPTTFEAMVKTAPLLEKISVERSFIEFDKLLMADFWRKGLRAMIDSKAYNFLPDLAGKGEQLASMLSSLAKDFRFSTSEQAWALLFVCLGIDNIKSFLKKWKTSNDFQRSVVKLVEIYQLRQEGPVTKQICFKYGKEFLYLVEELRQAQGFVTDFAAIDKIDQALTIHDKHEIVVNGGHLMKTFDLKPGPVLGELLKEVEFQIVEGQLENEEQAIMTFVKGILENE